MKFIALILLFAVFACTKNSEETLVTFHEKMMIQRDFDGAYEMLSAGNQREITKEKFASRMKELLKNPKYASLYDYQGKRSKIKIVKVEESGELAKKISFSYSQVRMSADFFDFYDERMKKLNSDNAEKVFDDKFLAEQMSRYNRSFFEDEKERIILLKEDGKWKVSLHNPEKIFDNVFGHRMWFKHHERALAEAKRQEKLHKTPYSDLVFREVASVYGARSAREVTLCAMGKTGDVSYGEVLNKHKASGSNKIVGDCVKQHALKHFR